MFFEKGQDVILKSPDFFKKGQDFLSILSDLFPGKVYTP